jgi:hypothetical protein
MARQGGEQLPLKVDVAGPESPPQQPVLDWIVEVTGASGARMGECIQSLWNGYGQVRRVALHGASVGSVILKWVMPPVDASHPRGWAGDRSHERKLRSYAVELAFWRDVAPRCDTTCRVPHCFGARRLDGEFQFLMEDLDAAGFSRRRQDLTPAEVAPCLAWLAAFHASFMGRVEGNLWPVGTYWHLDTRPDELAAIADPVLIKAAPHFDRLLNEASYATLVHGDAKVANFCFTPDGDAVAAVDFQYTGGGVGVKDVAYLLSSCLDSATCERHADACLDLYFKRLELELARLRPDVNGHEVERQWRALYPIAWADFVRFLAGWAPDHWKLNTYSRRMLQDALDAL